MSVYYITFLLNYEQINCASHLQRHCSAVRDAMTADYTAWRHVIIRTLTPVISGAGNSKPGFHEAKFPNIVSSSRQTQADIYILLFCRLCISHVYILYISVKFYFILFLRHYDLKFESFAFSLILLHTLLHSDTFKFVTFSFVTSLITSQSYITLGLSIVLIPIIFHMYNLFC